MSSERKRLLLGTVASLVAGAAGITAAVRYDISTVFVRRYTVASSKIHEDLRICFLSDLHGFLHGYDNEELIRKIDEQHPDLILIGGDMLIASETCSEKSEKNSATVAYRLISHLAEKYPVIACNGNHEQEVRHQKVFGDDFYLEYMQALRDEGVETLHNRGIFLEPYNIEITGLEVGQKYFGHFYKRKMKSSYLPEKIGEAKEDRFQLLLAHNPQYFEKYANWGADLTLSGHVHGGIIRLPFLGGVISPALILFPKYDGGRYRIGRRQMILSRGLGTHTIPVRLFNPCELVTIDLVGK